MVESLWYFTMKDVDELPLKLWCGVWQNTASQHGWLILQYTGICKCKVKWLERVPVGKNSIGLQQSYRLQRLRNQLFTFIDKLQDGVQLP